MKNHLLIIAASLLCISLSGCGNKEDNSNSASTTKNNNTSTTTTADKSTQTKSTDNKFSINDISELAIQQGTSFEQLGLSENDLKDSEYKDYGTYYEANTVLVYNGHELPIEFNFKEDKTFESWFIDKFIDTDDFWTNSISGSFEVAFYNDDNEIEAWNVNGAYLAVDHFSDGTIELEYPKK